MRKIILIVLAFLNMLTVKTYAISSKSAILIDSNSGRVLYEHNSYEKLPMASTTKIMTGLLACESEKLTDTVKVSAFASGTEGSSLWLKIGEKQTLENLTYGLMLKSGNDAAVAIAEYLGGSVDAFALLMNKRAREIGAVNTNFVNPHGLDADGHYTTAYDLALIAREAMKNDTFRKIVSTKTHSIPMEGEKWDRALKNHNKLLWNYDGCNGVKTGFTKKCGRCLVSSAAREESEFICVTLNAADDWNDHTQLLNFGFENFKTECVVKKDDKVTEYTYGKKNQYSVNLLAKREYKVALSKKDEIVTAVEFLKLKTPVKKGSTAGYLHVFCNGEEIEKIELITSKKIKEKSMWEKIIGIFDK